jgi:hypothetical protein
MPGIPTTEIFIAREYGGLLAAGKFIAASPETFMIYDLRFAIDDLPENQLAKSSIINHQS